MTLQGAVLLDRIQGQTPDQKKGTAASEENLGKSRSEVNSVGGDGKLAGRTRLCQWASDSVKCQWS